MKKKLAIASSVVAMAGVLAGCGIDFNFGGGSTTASDIVEKFMDLDPQNYHADVGMDFEIGMEADGMSVDIPVSFDLSVDILDGDMHGDMSMSTSFMGMDDKVDAEVYVVSGRKGYTTYSYDQNDGYWTVSESDSATQFSATLMTLDPDAFENATLETDKKGNYVITQPLSDFASMGGAADLVGDLTSDMTMLLDIDEDDMWDAWGDESAVYVFDEDFYLLSVDIEGCSYTGSFKEDGVRVSFEVNLDMWFEFSDYGKIKASDVDVPDSVVDSAVDSLIMYLPDSDIDVDVNISFGDDDAFSQDSFFDYDFEDESSDVYYEEEAEEDDAQAPAVSGYDVFGAYNGVAFNAGSTSWDTTFGADGWVFDNEDGEYSFMSAVNSKYVGVDVYVYNSLRQATTKDDILNDGIYGYTIDATYRSGSYPNITWNGITFGATLEDVKAAYGEPDYVYEGTMYTAYTYSFSGDVDIDFVIYPDKGVQKVDLSLY